MNSLNKQLRYVAYVRKSDTREDRQAISHSAQIRRIKEQFPDIKVVKWLEPESQSAFKPGRPIFEKMMHMIENNEADAIVSWHPNRISRNEIDSARVTYLLRSKLKDMKFCTFDFKNTADGIMYLQMIMNQSQYESAKIGVEVKRGMKEKAINGERPGQVPQGYVKQPIIDEFGKPVLTKYKTMVTTTQPDPERFDHVSSMWRMFLSGVYSPNEIRKIANEEWGFRTKKTKKAGGNKLGTSQIYRILNSVFYAGYIMHEGELLKGNHKPMITLEEYDHAQRLLGAKGKPRSGAFDYSFNGMMRCGKCDCSIVAKTRMKYVKSDDRLKAYVYYYCSRKSEQRPCDQVRYTPLSELEEQIIDELDKYTIIPEFHDLALKVLRQSNKIQASNRNQAYKNLQKEKKGFQEQLDKLISLLTRDILTEDEYFEQKNRIIASRSGIDAKLRKLESSSDEWMALAEDVFNFATTAKKRFKNGTLSDKRIILQTLGGNFTLLDNKLSLLPSEWLQPIAEHYPELEKRYLWVRTKLKAAPTTERETALNTIFESWRAI